MSIRIPIKPFDEYKWRWAVFTPTETLNFPPIFIGILRLLLKNENKRFSSISVYEGLQKIEEELKLNEISLAREPERNIFRNSQQYWKALGLLESPGPGIIKLSNFGKELASGNISQTEFATTIIKSLELPNRLVEKKDIVKKWDNIGLKVKPLELILNILAFLNENYGLNQGYITPQELIKIVIPLSGVNASVMEHADSIIGYRKKCLNLDGWPDCATSANDKRMAREFLLFLHNYGFCDVKAGANNYEEKYVLSNISVSEINELRLLQVKSEEKYDLNRVNELVRISQITANIERKKVVREVLDRPNQNTFRKQVLEVFGSTCLITGVKLDAVLEAAHIKPVKYGGKDTVTNGICLRADIHTLFDSNHLRITPSGEILLSEESKSVENYGYLPRKIILPPFIDIELLNWRTNYY